MTKKQSNAAQKGEGRAAMENSPSANANGFDLKWLLLIVVGVFVVAGAWYYTQGQNGAPVTTGPNATVNTVNLLTSPGAVALLSSFDHLQAMPNSYNLSFSEKIDGIDANISLAQKGNDRVAILTTAFNRREYYWIGNQTIACEQSATEPRVCAAIDNQTQLMAYGARLNATFPSTNNEAEQKANHARMIQLGALHFRAPPQSRVVAGRSCTDLTYTFDFTQLTPSQLGQIGMTVNDPLVTMFRNYVVEKCVDDQLGIALVSKLQYEYVDPRTQQHVQLTDGLQYQTFQTPLPGSLAAPALNANGTQLLEETGRVNDMLGTIGTCLGAVNVTDHDQCVRTSAVRYGNVGLCNLVNDSTVRGQCVIIIATDHNAPDECKLAGGLGNECYTNIAVNDRDNSYCKLIADPGQLRICMDAVALAKNMTGGAPAPGSGNATANQTGNATRPATGIY